MQLQSVGRSTRILVVDGCDVSRNAAHRTFFVLGFSNVEYAPDTRAALRLIGQNNYGLVLADWDKSPVSGLELLRQTRLDQRMRCLPFLMGISQWQKKFIEIVRDDGATLYLIKPFTPAVLSERMRQVVTDAYRLKLQYKQAETKALGEFAFMKGGPKIPALWQSLRPES